MLTLSDLSKTYPNGVQALKGITLSVDNGLFGLLGPNGAGKSTLMRTLATLQEPDSGRIVLDGQDVLADPQAHRLRLGYLPQEFGVYPGVSAAALLDHLALLKGVAHRRQRAEQVDALLHRTNLYEHRRKAVDTFSGGMRRRFGIAQALLGDPRLIIVDEPTAGLDPEERHRFHDLLSEIGERVIVVLSTHIVEDVRELCPRMAILSEGRVLLEGEPDRLVEALSGRVWRKTVDRETVATYRASLPVLSTQRHAGRTRIQVLADSVPEPGFEPVPPDLEDVYFSALAGGSAARPC
ncbi:ABC transporter ATP-binding protein [Hyalangium minutum]|uniref:ABC transporter ATP-binding protein n=1 Tax=Hyalangium minutum TaxID=394096 RepID=A0A085WRZ3_9BACT|nr:ABC transporter ATP-binding protein [Hyalangium minutum]KFE70456.1 ABC transporter ATP-binding protein [Hyalangium minutum]